MDYQFPRELFPAFYNSGPPDLVQKQGAGKWGSYDRVRPQGGSGPLSSWTFTSRHQVRGETWCHTEPVPVPLLSPKYSVPWPSTLPDPMKFTEHMQNFFVDHCQEAFGCMGEILGENFSFNPRLRKKYQLASVNTHKVKKILDLMKFKKCELTYSPRWLDAYNTIMSDVIHTIPPELLGALLHEELSEQRDRMLFSEGATGGALAFVPFSQSGSSSQHGCLIYPRNQGLDCLNFHRVTLQHHREGTSFVEANSSDPFSFQLKCPVRQISTASLFNDCCVAVRSDYLCGVWRFSEIGVPRLLQVINTGAVATCISVSPHVLGEVLVASENRAAMLWTVGRGMQKVREEDVNMYFNAESSWRWCEFSAHPRVMLYADRTGVELTDMRVKPVVGRTLFQISNTPECRSGERLILCRYLGETHSFHHLITTQYSAYIMDERFPGIPMVKWDHMMQSPPMFCHIVPGSESSSSGVDEGRTTKILLGSHNSQEVTMLQYSGGRAEASFSQGPPLSLHRPMDSLKHLPVQIPHRMATAKSRLSSPAAGLTCIQRKGFGEECICILQLTEAGDVFYQILEPEQPEATGTPAVDEVEPTDTQPAHFQTACQVAESDTSSDEGIIAPTQVLTAQRFVAETPESLITDSACSSDTIELTKKSRYLKTFGLEVVENREMEVSGLDAGTDDEKMGGNMSTRRKTLVKLSDNTLITWKRWLQKLVRKSRVKKSCSHTLPHVTENTEGLLRLPFTMDPAEEERVQSLRRDLKECMAKCSLLVQSTVSPSLWATDVVPVPNQVDTDAWTDELSQRLTVSWQGEEGWRSWWKEKLGLNREEKIAALKRKRRREKEMRRATGRRLELSGSFSTSISYQSELDSFSDLAGWSSAASQGVCSDTEGIGSQSQGFVQHGTPRGTTTSILEMDTAVTTLNATPQSIKDNEVTQETPSSSRVNLLSRMLKPDTTPDSQRRARRRVEDYLSSLFAPQEEPSQHDSYILEKRGSMQPLLSSGASSSQLFLSQAMSQNVVSADLSQDRPTLSRFSQSQSSQGRPGPSQGSQPKKKSRMGF